MSKNSCFLGKNGAQCSMSEIFKATTVDNAINDTSGWGNQVAGGVISATSDVPFACAAKNITGPCVVPVVASTAVMPTPVVASTTVSTAMSYSVLKPVELNPNFYVHKPLPTIDVGVLGCQKLEPVTPSEPVMMPVNVGMSANQLQQIAATQGEDAFNRAKALNTQRVVAAQNTQRMLQRQQEFHQAQVRQQRGW